MKPKLPTYGHYVTLECCFCKCTLKDCREEPHQLHWQSKVVAIDFAGPVYEDSFCPECVRKGRQETITEDGIAGLFSNQEIALIGQDNIHTFLFVVTQMFKPDDYRLESQLYPALTAEFIGKYSCETPETVERNIQGLRESRWLSVVPSAHTPGGGRPTEWRYQFSFGDAWQDFFHRVEAKKQELAPVTVAQQSIDLKPVKAIDCGHDSPPIVCISKLGSGEPSRFEYFDERLCMMPEETVTGSHPATLCPECNKAEASR